MVSQRLTGRNLGIGILVIAVLCVVIVKLTQTSQAVVKEPQALLSGREVFQVGVEEVDWLEISPQFGQTTYVNDTAVLAAVINLLKESKFRTLSPAELEVAKSKEPEPQELHLNGTTYQRNIYLEFKQKQGSQYGNRTVITVRLYGELVFVGDRPFVASTATDDFISLFDRIIKEGKGENRLEALQVKLPVTMETVSDLAAGRISAADIVREYRGRDVTSGIYSHYCEMANDYALMIGYTDVQKPLYIRLIDTRSNEYIDLTTNSLAEFLKKRESKK